MESIKNTKFSNFEIKDKIDFVGGRRIISQVDCVQIEGNYAYSNTKYGYSLLDVMFTDHTLDDVAFEKKDKPKCS